MSICYITLTSTGELIRQESETYFQAAQWCRLAGYGSADILFSATPPRSAPATVRPERFEVIIRRPSLLRRLFSV